MMRFGRLCYTVALVQRLRARFIVRCRGSAKAGGNKKPRTVVGAAKLNNHR